METRDTVLPHLTAATQSLSKAFAAAHDAGAREAAATINTIQALTAALIEQVVGGGPVERPRLTLVPAETGHAVAASEDCSTCGAVHNDVDRFGAVRS